MTRRAVIMAGGAGTRLWPLSRRERPKQLLRIVDGKSLLHEAFARLRLVFPPTDIYVIALAEHLPAIAEELPTLPPGNLIGEPVGRDTANAIGLAAAILHAKSPDTVMGVFTADHVIRPAERFAEVIERGFAAAEETPDALVTFGVKPTEPHTGLGYVERGEPHAAGVWRVRTFKEKPDLATARRYVDSGNFYWNSGMFVWRTAAILEQLRRHLPQAHAALMKAGAGWGDETGPRLASEVYPGLKKISIDFAVMEKAPNVLVVEMDLQWLDVGSWTALATVLGADAAGNTRALQRAVTLSSQDNILVAEGDHLIATLGVKDLVVVHSPDATLICHRDQVQRIRELVDRLQREYEQRYS
jgi:mannose-1-phosphate guanylyltransferase